MLKVLFRDGYYLAIHKPAGFDAYGETSDKDCQRFLQKRFQKKVYPVHRLDRDTNGILLFSFDGRSASELSRQFQFKRVEKHYEALVWGRARGVGSVDAALAKKSKTQSAQTDWKLIRAWDLGDENAVSLLKVSPKTGRFHQIRKHLALQGLPILGDHDHGSKSIDENFCRLLKIQKRDLPLMLVARAVSFFHYRLRKKLALETKPDPAYTKVLTVIKSLKLEDNYDS